MSNQFYPILLNLIAAFFGAGGQFLYKKGANKISLVPWWQNWQIFLGALFFIAVMALFVQSFKMGGRLSVVYPVYATTFIWGMLLGILIEGEPWNYFQIAGLIFIIAGVAILAMLSPQGL